MTAVKFDAAKDFATPLGLISFKYVKIVFDGPGGLSKQEQVPVPMNTAFVHIAVTAIDMGLGSATSNRYGTFSSLRFDTVVNKLQPGNLTYTVQAQLISQSVNDLWNGTIWLTILCFG